MNPNEEIWKNGDIVIHEADEPLHRNQFKNRMLMVILNDIDTDMLYRCKYIYPDEVKEQRNERDIRHHIQEELPMLLEKQTFQEFQNKCRRDHDLAMRRVYINHYSRLYDPETKNIVVNDKDYYMASKMVGL